MATCITCAKHRRRGFFHLDAGEPSTGPPATGSELVPNAKLACADALIRRVQQRSGAIFGPARPGGENTHENFGFFASPCPEHPQSSPCRGRCQGCHQTHWRSIISGQGGYPPALYAVSPAVAARQEQGKVVFVAAEAASGRSRPSAASQKSFQERDSKESTPWQFFLKRMESSF